MSGTPGVSFVFLEAEWSASSVEPMEVVMRVFSGKIGGIYANVAEIEVNPNNLPTNSWSMTGVHDGAVREFRTRVMSAYKSVRPEGGFTSAKVTCPVGSRLPICYELAILAGMFGTETGRNLDKYLFAAEVGLDGSVRRIAGATPIGHAAKADNLIVVGSKANIGEFEQIAGLVFIVLDTVSDLFELVRCHSDATINIGEANLTGQPKFPFDMAEISGQSEAKRAMEVAVAGGHSILLTGAPGCGRTMLARRAVSIMPKMTETKAMEVANAFSVSGLIGPDTKLPLERPFRAPHHTVSTGGLVGVGSMNRPAEATLANHGVLFLDELPEFRRNAINTLRQGLKNGDFVVNHRADREATYYPMDDVQLIGARSACYCGYRGDEIHKCSCTAEQLRSYDERWNASSDLTFEVPMSKMFDIEVRMQSIRYSELSNSDGCETSEEIRKRVSLARNRQMTNHGRLNSRHGLDYMVRYIGPLCEDNQTVRTLAKIAASGDVKVLQVSMTIRDLKSADGAWQTDFHWSHFREALKLVHGIDGWPSYMESP